MFQYIPYLISAGFSSKIAPFLDDDYLGKLYAGSAARSNVVRAFAARISRLIRNETFDLLWIEKEALPWVPWTIEAGLLPGNIPIASDYDDAIFHQYDSHNNIVLRRVLGTKIDRLMKSSTLVLAGNTYLAERALAAGSSRVEIVPTVVDAATYSFQQRNITDRGPRIGWVGMPSTWREFMRPAMPMITDVASAHSARICAVGAGNQADAHPSLDNEAWSEETEVGLIQGMDIGIMPLNDSPWARGKCGYKLIQYMACGLPVVASPVGVNSEIVEHGVNGFLASSEAEWREALNTLLGNRELRLRMGSAGRKKVEQEYSLQVYGPKVATLLEDAVRSNVPNN